MSAPGGGPNLTVRVLFSIDVKAQTQEAAAMTAELRKMGDVSIQTGDILVNMNQATRSTGYSLRRTLLDLRMFSFAVRTLRREFGSTNPIVDAASSALLIVSAAATGTMTAYSMLTQAQRALSAGTVTAAATMAGLKTGMTALLAVAKALWPVWVILGGLIAGIAIGEYVSGIDSIQRSIKGWKEEVEDLGRSMRDLNLEMGLQNEEMQYYQLWVSNVERAIAKQGYETEAQTRSLEYLNQQLEAGQYEYRRMGYEASVTQNRVAGLTVEMEKGQEEIKAIRGRAMGVWDPRNWGGGRGAMPGYGGGGGAQVTINIPGAIFNNISDVVSTLQQAGAAAAAALDPSIERGRYGAKGRMP